jgi:hypothetical protein
MADAGKIEMDCGIVSYKIEPPLPPPADPSLPPPPLPIRDTRYRLMVHQEMERENSFVE